jgi:two-component system, NtrC family, sensor kinase
MYLQVVLSIIILNYLRKSLREDGLLPKWDKVFIIGIVVSLAFAVIQVTVPGSDQIVLWVSQLLLLAIVYHVFTRKEFHSAKSLVTAMLPLIVIKLISDFVETLFNDFYKEWDDYFEIAALVGLIWLIAIWFIGKRQRKALEQEKLKALEKEKEYRITEKLKAELEIQVVERTAALTTQKEELQKTIVELKATQAQLIQSEKMASLGELTAGIAHEIQNPLNFVNNFSEVSNELISEMIDEVKKGNVEDAEAIANDIKQNLEKINHHGKRADAIVKGMLQHSRSSSGTKEPTDINALADEYLRLAYHGLRAKDKSFNATMKTEFDESIGNINITPQDMGRVILNLITNAFYVVNEKQKARVENYEPTVTISTKKTGNKILISVTDNGSGIPEHIKEKIFQPFFTTKPTGQGTGLGLSLSYDIVKAHGGELKVETRNDEGTTFIILLTA